MATKHDKPVPEKESRQASSVIAFLSVIGLTICFVAAKYYKADVPIVLYAIFGGAILGTDNVLKLIKTVFRIGSNGK